MKIKCSLERQPFEWSCRPQLVTRLLPASSLFRLCAMRALHPFIRRRTILHNGSYQHRNHEYFPPSVETLTSSRLSIHYNSSYYSWNHINTIEIFQMGWWDFNPPNAAFFHYSSTFTQSSWTWHCPSCFYYWNLENSISLNKNGNWIQENQFPKYNENSF